MKEITLTLPLINTVLQYLGTRPYQEVFQIIAEIQKQAQENERTEADS